MDELWPNEGRTFRMTAVCPVGCIKLHLSLGESVVKIFGYGECFIEVIAGNCFNELIAAARREEQDICQRTSKEIQKTVIALPMLTI